MKKFAITALTAVMLLGSIGNASAISSAFRHKLERSGCTQVTEANGTCDPNKTKAQNFPKKKAPVTNMKSYTNDATAVMDTSIKLAAEFLLSQGWTPNNGDWHKGKHIMRLVVEDGIVVNAQVM